jgi:diaminohydroxyphosphoribosylaminopyrimidine deaminase/5-amino-6-(5-phosphoribosylamino)uracil reductase
MRDSNLDLMFMDQALELAARAYGETAPNPLVGAVVVRDGVVIGSGFHRAAGLAHAEPQALDAARASVPMPALGERAWTLYVNLEPCTHHGRTPPCIDAILESPVGRVVVGHADPDARVSGRGIERLRAAGIQVDVGCRAEGALELNHVFIARQRRGRPFIALKVALSADGCVAAAAGSPVAITGAAARRHTHRLRAGLDAVLIGVETLRLDRPQLDRRLYEGPGRAPRRLILDPSLKSDPAWLWPGEARPVLFCTQGALDRRHAELEPAADLVVLPERGARFDLAALPGALEALGLTSLLVEGGGETHRSFLQADLWDRFHIYRNRSLQLAGVKWSAADLWGGIEVRATVAERLALGTDDLETWGHPALAPEFF